MTPFLYNSPYTESPCTPKFLITGAYLCRPTDLSEMDRRWIRHGQIQPSMLSWYSSLKERGHTVRTARDAEEGLRLYCDCAPFSVVLIDYSVPKECGNPIDDCTLQNALGTRDARRTDRRYHSPFCYNPRPRENYESDCSSPAVKKRERSRTSGSETIGRSSHRAGKPGRHEAHSRSQA